MPGEVLAPTKDHTTLSVAPALESLGRGGAVALRVGGLGGGGLRGGGLEDRLGNMGDGDGHVWRLGETTTGGLMTVVVSVGGVVVHRRVRWARPT